MMDAGKNIVERCLLILILFLAPTPAFLQNRMVELQKEKEQLEKAIDYTNVLIDQTRSQKQTTLNDLTLVNSQINYRQQLIANHKEEQNFLLDTIFLKLTIINDLALELAQLKDEYARMICSAYKNKNIYQRMLYVVAADDFNQAFRRFNYYKHYASHRVKQAQTIVDAKADYFDQIENLETQLEKNQQLIASLNEENTLLKDEKELKNKTVLMLAAKEKELIGSQKKDKKYANQLKQSIQSILEEERLAKAAANAKSKLMMFTPEEKLLSSGFSANQGSLPWPARRGVLSSSYGEHEHQELKGIKIRNNGINILTHQGSKARAVYDGEVTRVLAVPNFNNVVIIRHGEFLTVYSNLNQVLVESGSRVEAKQEIGVVYTDPEDAKTELHFEIWKGKDLEDPMLWLSTQKSPGMLRIETP